MLELRAATDRGHADHGWLQSAHSFSFANYFDPAQMGFGPLRVINEDKVAPGAGFGRHGHRDMEIISYVIDGRLAHQDSMGNGSTIAPGDVQRMTAGTGVEHSEFNPQQSEGTHFLQIWIEPAERGLAPGYEERRFDQAAKRGRLCLIGSGHGEPDAVTIHQDVRLFAGLFDGDESAQWSVAPGRLAYLHLVGGRLTVNGLTVDAGDGVKVHAQPEGLTLALSGGEAAEVLLFDMVGD